MLKTDTEWRGGTHERVCLQHLIQEGKSDGSASLKVMSSLVCRKKLGFELVLMRTV